MPTGPPIFPFTGDEELATLLRAHQLTDIHVRTISFSHPERSPDALWSDYWAVRSGPPLSSSVKASETQRQIRRAFDRIMQQYRFGAALKLPVSVKLASARTPAQALH